MAADAPRDDAEAWLDGLAGRRADADAQVLRDALLPLPSVDTPPWDHIEARAAAVPALVRGAGAADAPAANQVWPMARMAWAAMLVLAVALGAWWLQPEAPDGLRGGGPAAMPVWRVPDAVAAADRLAAELQRAGATVERVQGPDAGRVVLRIVAPPAAVAAVNARLAPLETGLDAQGRLELSVESAP